MRFDKLLGMVREIAGRPLTPQELLRVAAHCEFEEWAEVCEFVAQTNAEVC